MLQGPLFDLFMINLVFILLMLSNLMHFFISVKVLLSSLLQSSINITSFGILFCFMIDATECFMVSLELKQGMITEIGS